MELTVGLETGTMELRTDFDPFFHAHFERVARAAASSRGLVLTSPPSMMTAAMVTVDDVREVARTLPRAYEVLVHDRVKFRVGRIVFLAFSRDETTMGFAFPKEEREALVGSEPQKFEMPPTSDLRYHWVVVNLDAIGRTEMREIVLDAWRMVVPKKVGAAFDGSR